MSKLSALWKRWFSKSRRASAAPAARELGVEDDWIFRGIIPNSVVIDCGANVGKVTACLLARGAFVHAFEPNPFAFAVLRQRFGNHQSVRLYNKAVSDRAGTMPLYLMQNAAKDQVARSVGSSLVAEKINVDRSNALQVDVVDLCEFIHGLPGRIALLKLDVEGVECAIMNKLITMGLHSKIDLILVETHERKIATLKDEVLALRRRIDELGIVNIRLDWN